MFYEFLWSDPAKRFGSKRIRIRNTAWKFSEWGRIDINTWTALHRNGKIWDYVLGSPLIGTTKEYVSVVTTQSINHCVKQHTEHRMIKLCQKSYFKKPDIWSKIRQAVTRGLQVHLEGESLKSPTMHLLPQFKTQCFGPQCFGSGSARIRIKKCLLDPDPDPHGQMRIRIQEVKKP